METCVNHIESFLNITLDSDLQSQYTLKFFKKDNVGFQNSLLVNRIDKTIVDMKITDKDIFNKISNVFGEKNQVTEVVEISANISIYEFLAKIVEPIEEYAVIGFVSHISNGPNQERLPGSQCLNYVII